MRYINILLFPLNLKKSVVIKVRMKKMTIPQNLYFKTENNLSLPLKAA